MSKRNQLDILSKLEEYYQEKELYPNLNLEKLPRQDVCFKATSVGENYTNAKFKLLVISSDPAYMKSDEGSIGPSESSKIHSNYWQSEDKNWQSEDKRGHWYKTVIFVANILKSITKDIPIDKKSVSYFAHVNSTKFKVIGAGKKEGPEELWEYCKKKNYIKDEIEILQPDIIWTQGNRARDSFINAFPEKKILEKKDNYNINERTIAGKKVLWIRTKHPTSHGYFPTQKGLFKHTNEIAEILKKHLSLS